ncbi:MAG TPA: hypothetical protein VK183_05440 [Flavobacterium sp.]|nr:hypothetical protein [Flavobacterium sp.]
MKKRNWRNIWINVRLVLIFIGLLALYSFTLKRNESRPLRRTEVTFEEPKTRYITETAVNKLLIENKTAPRDVRVDEVDLGRLEKSIDANDMVEKSEVFVTIDGCLHARVKQKTPVARVVGEEGSFYLDNEGNAMPLSPVSAARVPLISGDLTAADSKKLGELFRMVHDDDFLKKNIIGARIMPNGSILMQNRNYEYVIEFGRTIHMRRKFDNYKAFFQKAVRDSLLDDYRNINLKFIRQVVCTR